MEDVTGRKVGSWFCGGHPWLSSASCHGMSAKEYKERMQVGMKVKKGRKSTEGLASHSLEGPATEAPSVNCQEFASA